MLYTLSQPLKQLDMANLLALINPNDAILLWQDGVIVARKSTPELELLISKSKLIYVLDNDLLARGLYDQIDPRISVIDMQKCVELTAEHFPQLAW